MRINFVRTGGFAGMRLETTVDSDTLPPDEAQVLQQELQQANFFALPSQLTGKSAGADRFQYEISVDTGGQRHTVQTGESSMPEALQPLIQHLDRLART